MGKRKREEADAAVAGGGGGGGGGGAAPLSQPSAVPLSALEAPNTTLVLLRAPAGFDWSRLDGCRVPIDALLRAAGGGGAARGAARGGAGMRLRRLGADDDLAPQISVLCALDGEEAVAAEAAAAEAAAEAAAAAGAEPPPPPAGRIVSLLRRGLAGTVVVEEVPAEVASDTAAAPAPRFSLLAPVALQHRLPVAPPQAPAPAPSPAPAPQAAPAQQARGAPDVPASAGRRRTGSKASGRSH